MRSALGLWLLLVLAGPACAQSGAPAVTINPAMVKGAAAAAVTIVEFSDYQ
jgi:hypothetical protein